jgi:UDP-N-acetylglucosamine enolpyruvyl transferase
MHDEFRKQGDTRAPIQYFVEGGRRLTGTIEPSGNKNAALPIIAASLLTEQPVTLNNVPRIRDTETLVQLSALRPNGARAIRLTYMRRTSAQPISIRNFARGYAPRSCSQARCWRAAAG